MSIRLLSALIALPLAACGSSLSVHEIANDAPIGTKVDGIPFRVPRAYTVALYKAASVTDDQAKAYAPQDPTAPTTSATIPDMSHLYVLGFSGQPLSNPTINIALNPDGTISSASLSSSPSGQQALAAVATQMTAANSALQSNRTGANTAASAYASALSAYYTAMQAYCSVSKASPRDAGAVRVAAANVLVAQVGLSQAHDAANETQPLPYSKPVDPATDIGTGCP